jgi:hypothetical protein
MMNNLQDQQPPGVDQQQRAQSFPPFERRSDIAKAMGRTYRTPSPACKSYYASGKSPFNLGCPAVTNTAALGSEITPRADPKFNRVFVMETPPGSPTALTEVATPICKQTLLNSFGLLTPKTPLFDDLIRPSPATVDGGEDDKPGTCTVSPLSEKCLDAKSENHDVASTRATTVDVEPQAQTETQYDKLQEQIRDAALAASLAHESDNPGKRRSSRLAKKEAVKGKLFTPSISHHLTIIW